jgi:hypothetical protein
MGTGFNASSFAGRFVPAYVLVGEAFFMIYSGAPSKSLQAMAGRLFAGASGVAGPPRLSSPLVVLQRGI